MSNAAPGASAGLDLAALDAITDAVAAGAGLPDVVRAAARALDASLVLSDPAGNVLAVAARSTADEKAMLDGREGVDAVELRVGDEVVGSLLVRVRGEADALALRLVTTLVASETARLHAPERASAAAAAEFLSAITARELGDGDAAVVAAADLGLDIAGGASVLVVRAHAHVTGAEGRRERVLAVVERGARGAVPGAIAALTERRDVPGDEAIVLLPTTDPALAERAAESVRRELQAG